MSVLLSLSRDLIAWGLGRRKIFRVRGRSMCPTLNDGDIILVQLTREKAPAIDTIVVARHPQTGSTIVKRVLSLGKQAAYLGSDNPNEGTDSRHFGSVNFSDIRGTLVRRIKRPSPKLR